MLYLRLEFYLVSGPLGYSPQLIRIKVDIKEPVKMSQADWGLQIFFPSGGGPGIVSQAEPGGKMQAHCSGLRVM